MPDPTMTARELATRALDLCAYLTLAPAEAASVLAGKPLATVRPDLAARYWETSALAGDAAIAAPVVPRTAADHDVTADAYEALGKATTFYATYMTTCPKSRAEQATFAHEYFLTARAARLGAAAARLAEPTMQTRSLGPSFQYEENAQ